MNEKYDVFISYRRDGGESTAKMLHDKLENLGYRVFFDVESLRSGNFNTALYSVIDECKDFLLVLSPDALDRCKNEDDWVRLEIEHALEQGLNIVPIMLRGFSFPQELPPSIDDVRYKNGIEASYQFFDAFIGKLQNFLVSDHSGVRRRKPKYLLGAVALTVFLGIALILWFVGDRQDSGYPRTDYERNVTRDFIYYVETLMQQIEQAFEYMDESYQACNEYAENYDTASYSALLAELSRNKRQLGQIDTDSSLMSSDLRNELKDSPFELADACAMHDYLVLFVESSMDTLEFMEVLTEDGTFVDSKTMKDIISNYQEMLNEECKNVAYCTNALFLAIEDEEALEEFKYTFLPSLYYIKLQASNWSNDKKSLESDQERSWNAIEKAQNRNLAIVGDDKLEVMLIKAEMIQQLMSEGADYETAEMIVEELSGRIQLVAEKKLSNKALKKEVEEKKRALEEAKQNLESKYDEIREKFAPSIDDESGELWGKMLRFLNVRLYDEAIACIDVYREKMRGEDEYVEDYCAAVVRFIRNISKTGIDYGVMVVGYDPDNPRHHEQYKVGDVIIAVDGAPCHNYEEYARFKDEREEGQDFTVVVLREDEENPGELKQIKLEIPGDAPKVKLMQLTEKTY